MKKFFQISLVVMLLFALFQTTVDGSTISGKIFSNTAENFVSTAIVSAPNAHAVCLVYIKDVVCIHPNVGWNS